MIINCKNIKKTYCSGNITTLVLKDINLIVNKGEFLAIMGASGSGKSTLLNILSGLDNQYSGSVLFNDRDISLYDDFDLAKMRNNEIGFVFQEFHLFDSLSAFENIALPLSLNNPTPRELSIKVHKVLDDLEIKHLKDRYPNEMSRGQQQRVAIARALINDPKVIFADEPTGNLDIESTKNVLHLLHKINKNSGVTVVLVTHDELCAMQCDRVISIYNGHLEVKSV